MTFQKTEQISGEELNTNINFDTISPYKYATGNGEIIAKCSPDYVSKKPMKIVVTVENNSDKIAQRNPIEEFRIEKFIDGQWYYYHVDYEDGYSEVCRIINAHDSRVYEYKIPSQASPGIYRILYLFKGNWCTAKFEIA